MYFNHVNKYKFTFNCNFSNILSGTWTNNHKPMIHVHMITTKNCSLNKKITHSNQKLQFPHKIISSFHKKSKIHRNTLFLHSAATVSTRYYIHKPTFSDDKPGISL